MSVDYKNFFRIFLCKDIEELKDRLAFLALENIESEGYYEVGDSWIEDEKLKEKVLKRILKLQEDALHDYTMLIDSMDQYGDINKSKHEQAMRGIDCGGWVVVCLVDFLLTKRELAHAVKIYTNYPEKDIESDNPKPPYSDEYIKEWLKEDYEQIKYK